MDPTNIINEIAEIELIISENIYTNIDDGITRYYFHHVIKKFPLGQEFRSYAIKWILKPLQVGYNFSTFTEYVLVIMIAWYRKCLMVVESVVIFPDCPRKK